MRLAWFSPWPPQRSGVAGRSAEIVPILAEAGHAIDVFVDANLVPVPVARADVTPPAAGAVRIQSAHDFVWRQLRHQYDLCVYQLGNSALHRFEWAYLFRWPGLVVLHDARLHHARADALLSQRRQDDYRAEVAWNHPEAGLGAAGPAILGFDGPHFFAWPMLRSVVESARLVASHSPGVVTSLRDTWPDRPVAHIALGEGPDRYDVEAAREAFRARHRIAPDAMVFGVHGGLTPEKRIANILAAFAATRSWAPDARLLLVGAAPRRVQLEAQIAQWNLDDAVCRVEQADDAEFDQAIAASDVTLNLRWPTALETSGPWLRSLALGRATIVLDLAHQPHVIGLDPRTWRRHAPCEDLSPDADARAFTVSIDILDEDHSLRIAMRRLATDPDLRRRLGRAARQYWEREHSVGRMRADYERVLAEAVQRPVPPPTGPPHLRPDPAAHVRELLHPIDPDGTLAARLDAFWT